MGRIVFSFVLKVIKLVFFFDIWYNNMSSIEQVNVLFMGVKENEYEQNISGAAAVYAYFDYTSDAIAAQRRLHW